MPENSKATAMVAFSFEEIYWLPTRCTLRNFFLMPATECSAYSSRSAVSGKQIKALFG